MNDPRRRFSKTERGVLFLASDGVSEVSGLPLGPDWHADHVVPWSKGGPTDLVNAQALTATENLKKGNRIMKLEPRGWQRDFLAAWLACPDTDFFAAVIPAGGKTIGSLFCGQAFLAEASRALVVMVPTVNVQKNWQSEASKLFGIELASSLDEFRRGSAYRGLVLTYQALTEVTAKLLRHLSGKRGLMVVADEVHHLADPAEDGDAQVWGERYRTAFEFALRRLAVTGTPFRSKPGEFMPFLPVDEDTGAYRINYSYDYPSALEDRHVRALAFHYHEFDITKTAVAADGGWRNWQLSTRTEHLTDADADDLLRKAIWDDAFVCELLRAADQKLQWKRTFVSDAAGLVIAADQDHAEQFIVPRLEQISGQKPDLLITNAQTTSVDDFRHSNRRWIVAVNKISEGTDIPRLSVLAMLATKKTEMWFRQANGRIMRRRNPNDDNEAWAYCYIPNHPALHSFARKIEDWQERIIGSRSEPEPREPGPGDGASGPSFVYSDGRVEYGGMIAHGEEFENDLSREATELSTRTGYDEAIIADILKAQRTPRSASADEDVSEPLEHRLKRKSTQIERMSRQWARRNGWEWKEPNRVLVKRYGKIRSKLSENEMDDAIRFLTEQLAKNGPDSSR